MPEIINILLSSVDANPFRRTGEYPYVERKLDALQKSIEDVGLWEGVIARVKGNRFQIAFGHHRIEAARRAKLKRVDLVVRELDDEQMLQFMGRENLEDYNSDFLTMLETWEAAWKWRCDTDHITNPQAIDIARILGWTSARKHRGKDSDQMSRTASACFAASRLVEGGYVAREDLKNLTVNQAREICERAQANIERLEEMGQTANRPRKSIEEGKKQVGKAVKSTAEDVSKGLIAEKNLRGEVDVNTYRFAKEAKAETRRPIYEQFCKQLSNQISKVLEGDGLAKKLSGMCGADTSNEESTARVTFELRCLSERALEWADRLESPKQTRRPKTQLKVIGDK